MATANTNPAAASALILDVDVCDATTALCEELSVSDATLAEFAEILRRAGMDQNPAGGYAKVRATLAIELGGVEHEIGFRIDVRHVDVADAASLLREHFAGLAAWLGGEGAGYAKNAEAAAASAKLYSAVAAALA